MHVMVVGGAGYIGSHVTRLLLDNEIAVTVFDNLSSGKRENLFPEAQFVEGDILDDGAMDSCFNNPGTKGRVDAVIHLAALKAAGESMDDPSRYAVNNIAGSVKLFAAMDRAGVGTCVFSSSAAVYGEPQALPVDESHSTQPENFYGFTKLEIEEVMQWYDRLGRMRVAALRYFNAAGYDPSGRVRGLEKNPANLIPVVMEVAMGTRASLAVFGDDYPTRDGSGIRDYVHVSDLAQAHLLALHAVAESRSSLTVNLGSESGTSVFEVLDSARRICDREIPARVVERRPGDPAELVASSRMAKERLGWNPRYSDIDTLLRTTWAVYREIAAG